VGGPFGDGFAKWMRGADKVLAACCCFAAGTPILSADGNTPVEQIKVGEKVWAKNTETGEVALKPVTELFRTPAKPLYALSLLGADGQVETVEVTDNHPYWVIDQGWVDSGQLMAGMRIESLDQGVLTVQSLVNLKRDEVTYNFTVGEFHTYFVGEQRALVHNCKKCDLTDISKPGASEKNYRINVNPAEFERSLVESGFQETKRTVGKNGEAVVYSNGESTYTLYNRTSGGSGAQFTGKDGTIIKYSLETEN
jgi:hypothetical protein